MKTILILALGFGLIYGGVTVMDALSLPNWLQLVIATTGVLGAALWLGIRPIRAE